MAGHNEDSAPKRLKTHQDLKETLVLRLRQPAPRFGWNSLPAELRLEIYYYLIPRFKHAINISTPKFENRFFREYSNSIVDSSPDKKECKDLLPWTKILLINKQISHECLDILYGKNSFQIEMHKTGEADLRANFTRENRQRMRYITVAFLGTEGATFPPGNSTPDYDLWAEILPYIKELWIVTVQPYKPPAPDDISVEEAMMMEKLWERFQQYLEWLPPYLECFCSLMRPGMGINILNTDDGWETSDIIHNMIPFRVESA